jgi:asparagine N-glycosylation enzyme membrane subunit Stt3
LKNKALVALILVLVIAFIAFSARMQSVPAFEGKYLMALDPYPYLRYAEQIRDTGYILPVDDLRYYPLGLETQGLLYLHSYFSAQLYFLFNMFSNLSMTQIFIVYPAIATFLGLIAFYFAIKELFKNEWIGVLTVALLGFTPGFLFRTAVGYADKEPLSVFLFPLVLFFFIKAIRTSDKKKRWIFAFLSMLSTAALMSNWAGGIFLLGAMAGTMIILTLLDRVNKRTLETFSIWVLFFPTMIIANSLNNPSSYLFNPKFLIVVFSYLLMLMINSPIGEKLKRYCPKKIPSPLFSIFVLTLIILGITLVVNTDLVISIFDSITSSVTNPFGTSRFTTSVSEFQKPYFDPNWWQSFGFSFFFFIAGSTLLFYKTLRKLKFSKILGIAFLIFILFYIFSNFSPGSPITQLLSNLYVYSLILFLLIVLYLYFKNWDEIREKRKSIKLEYVLILVWFFLTIAAARGAIRVLWALVMPASILSAYAVVEGSNFIRTELQKRNIKDKLYRWIPYALIAVILFNFVGITYATGFGATQERIWDLSSFWVSENIPEDAVFTHWWDYGYWVQSIFHRTTVFDGGNYRSDWNEINARYIMTGLNKSQWMSGLNYLHRPDYMVVIDEDIGKFYQMARIGERDYYPGMSIYYSSFRPVEMAKNIIEEVDLPDMYLLDLTTGPGIVTEDLIFDGVVWPKQNTFVGGLLIPAENETLSEPYGIIYNTRLQTQRRLPFNCKCVRDDKCYTVRDDGIPGCYLVLNPVDYGPVQAPFGVIFIPDMAKNMLFTRLYIVNESMPEFELVHENGIPLSILSIGHGAITNLKIWKINYDVYNDYLLEPCDVETKCSDLKNVKEVLG